MENNKKEYNTEKLSAFLSKVKTKLDEGVENIGTENNKIISNWLEDLKLKSTSDKIIEVSYNQSLMNHPINECVDESPLFNDILSQCNILFDTKRTIPQKEEVFAKIINNHFNEENILSDSIDIKRIEEFLVSVIVQSESKSDEYINQVSTSIKLMSILMKKIVSLSLKDKNITHVLRDYCNEFANSFSRLVYFQDCRLRLCISHAIGNIISYMLKENYEDNIIKIVMICSNELYANFEQNILKHGASLKDINDKDKQQNSNKESSSSQQSIPKESFMTLDSTKNILIEVLPQLKIPIGNYQMCQCALIENINKMCLYIDNNSIISILLVIYELLGVYLRIPFYNDLVKENIISGNKDTINFDFKHNLLTKTSDHLLLPNPQLRFWIIKFLSELNKVYQLRNDSYFMINILPKICLNRYLPVDGVQKNSMALWKEIVDMSGIDIIKANYEAFLTIYINELFSQGQETREAACRCIQEIIMKVYQDNHKSIMEKHYSKMLQGIIDCCKHPSWNVRETGLVAIGYVYTSIINFLDDTNKKIIKDIVKYHCFDNIIEVRDASAFALKTLLLSHINFLDEQNEKLYFNLIHLLNDRTEIGKLLDEIKKEVISFITSSHDFGFLRDIDLIDFQNGIMQLIKELVDVPNCFLFTKNNMKLGEISMIVIDFFCKNYSVLTNLSKKTIWETLTLLFSKMNKGEIDMYLDYIIDLLLKELNEHRNSLSGFQAEKFITSIAQGANKRMIKGKVKNKIKGCEALNQVFDKLFQ